MQNKKYYFILARSILFYDCIAMSEYNNAEGPLLPDPDPNPNTAYPPHAPAPAPEPAPAPSLPPQTPALGPPASLPRLAAEPPRAFSAFITYFQLGLARSLQAVADSLDIPLPTLKRWSSRFNWAQRIQSFNSGLLNHEARAQADHHRLNHAAWAARLDSFREQEWETSQKLLAAVQCFLESFDDEDLKRMTLSQVSRAFRISSTIGRLALSGAQLPPEKPDSTTDPVQQQLLRSLNLVYGSPDPSPNPGSPGQPQPAPGRDAVSCVPI